MNCPKCRIRMLDLSYFRDNQILAHLIGADLKGVSHICPKCGHKELMKEEGK